MKTATFFIHNGLLNLLPKKHKYSKFNYCFSGNQTVKHLIESLGIPHTEIDQIRVGDRYVGFNYIVYNEDIIYIFPYRINNSSFGMVLQKRWSSNPKFVLDNHLGKLAKYLRMLGLDISYSNKFQDEELVKIAHSEDRLLLSRDRRLLMHKIIKNAYLIRNTIPKGQLIEVIERFNLSLSLHPFQRCLNCNQKLEDIQKEEIIGRLLPLTKRYYNEFRICYNCDQVYWKGSHYVNMTTFLKNIITECKVEDEQFL